MREYEIVTKLLCMLRAISLVEKSIIFLYIHDIRSLTCDL